MSLFEDFLSVEERFAANKEATEQEVIDSLRKVNILKGVSLLAMQMQKQTMCYQRTDNGKRHTTDAYLISL